MRNLSELNINEGGRRVVRPAPSDSLIREFESKYKVQFPAAYIALLQYSNGGHPELDSIAPIGRPEGSKWSVDQFYHLDADRASIGSLWIATEKWHHIIGESSIPFAFDGGGNQFFLDFQNQNTSVKLCIHDQGFLIIDIAPSFEAFVDALSTDPDMI